MSALTREEHETRAMLLGRKYDWRDNTYCLPGMFGDLSNVEMLDADTLELIDKSDAYERTKRHGTGGEDLDTYDQFPGLPWRVTR